MVVIILNFRQKTQHLSAYDWRYKLEELELEELELEELELEGPKPQEIA